MNGLPAVLSQDYSATSSPSGYLSEVSEPPSKMVEAPAKLRVLYVDDDDLNRMVIEDMLAIVDVQMIGAEGGQIGIDLLKHQTFDIVLMDLRMPGMDGLEAIGTIRGMGFKSLPMIVVTADTAVDIREICLAAGANEIIFKPVAMDVLFETMGQVLANSS